MAVPYSGSKRYRRLGKASWPNIGVALARALPPRRKREIESVIAYIDPELLILAQGVALKSLVPPQVKLGP